MKQFVTEMILSVLVSQNENVLLLSEDTYPHGFVVHVQQTSTGENWEVSALIPRDGLIRIDRRNPRTCGYVDWYENEGLDKLRKVLTLPELIK